MLPVENLIFVIIKFSIMPRRKVTPFARFLLAMVIIIPLAFAGASYINGEDPIANFKQWTGMETKSEEKTAPAAPKAETTAAPPEAEAEKAAPEKRDEEALRAEVEKLKKQLKQRDQAIEDLRQQLENCQ